MKVLKERQKYLEIIDRKKYNIFILLVISIKI